MPALGRAGEISYQTKAGYEATLTILALQRWKADHGAYPESLAELVQGEYLQRVPDDPYAEGTLRYEKREDNFVLYSLGEDFEDNGGIEDPEDSWGRKEKGYDRVFWKP